MALSEGHMDRADKMELLHAALRDDDAAEFARLLSRFRNCRYDEGGGDSWLSTACLEGKLWAVELLLRRGGDLNKPSCSTDSVPAPEGTIVEAAGSGNLELIRFLLQRGAVVNHTVGGQVRCYALSRAARKGHLQVVQLLVERGAALNSLWARKTALDHAEEWGQTEVADFLRSVGGKSVLELEPTT